MATSPSSDDESKKAAAVQTARKILLRAAFYTCLVAYLLGMFLAIVQSIQDGVIWLAPLLVASTVPTMGVVAAFMRDKKEGGKFTDLFKPGIMGYTFVFGGLVGLPLVALGAAMCWWDVSGGSERDVAYTSFGWKVAALLLALVAAIVIYSKKAGKCIEADKPEAKDTPTMQFLHWAIVPSVMAALHSTAIIPVFLLSTSISWYWHGTFVTGILLILGGTALTVGLFVLDKMLSYDHARPYALSYDWARRESVAARIPPIDADSA